MDGRSHKSQGRGRVGAGSTRGSKAGRGRKPGHALKFHNFVANDTHGTRNGGSQKGGPKSVMTHCLREEHGTKQITVSHWKMQEDEGDKKEGEPDTSNHDKDVNAMQSRNTPSSGLSVGSQQMSTASPHSPTSSSKMYSGHMNGLKTGPNIRRHNIPHSSGSAATGPASSSSMVITAVKEDIKIPRNHNICSSSPSIRGLPTMTTETLPSMSITSHPTKSPFHPSSSSPSITTTIHRSSPHRVLNNNDQLLSSIQKQQQSILGSLLARNLLSSDSSSHPTSSSGVNPRSPLIPSLPFLLPTSLSEVSSFFSALQQHQLHQNLNLNLNQNQHSSSSSQETSSNMRSSFPYLPPPFSSIPNLVPPSPASLSSVPGLTREQQHQLLLLHQINLQQKLLDHKVTPYETAKSVPLSVGQEFIADWFLRDKSKNGQPDTSSSSLSSSSGFMTQVGGNRRKNASFSFPETIMSSPSPSPSSFHPNHSSNWIHSATSSSPSSGSRVIDLPSTSQSRSPSPCHVEGDEGMMGWDEGNIPFEQDHPSSGKGNKRKPLFVRRVLHHPANQRPPGQPSHAPDQDECSPNLDHYSNKRPRMQHRPLDLSNTRQLDNELVQNEDEEDEKGEGNSGLESVQPEGNEFKRPHPNSGQVNVHNKLFPTRCKPMNGSFLSLHVDEWARNLGIVSGKALHLPPVASTPSSTPKMSPVQSTLTLIAALNQHRIQNGGTNTDLNHSIQSLLQKVEQSVTATASGRGNSSASSPFIPSSSLFSSSHSPYSIPHSLSLPTSNNAMPLPNSLNGSLQAPQSTGCGRPPGSPYMGTNSSHNRGKHGGLKQKLEDAFKNNGFLVKTKQVNEGDATFCKFRQLRKYSRYYLKSWHNHLPSDLNQLYKQESSSSSSPPGPSTSHPPVASSADTATSTGPPVSDQTSSVDQPEGTSCSPHQSSPSTSSSSPSSSSPHES